MDKKIIVIAFVAVFAVPYGAKLLAGRGKNVRELKEKLERVNKQIEKLEQSMQKSENLCETEQTRGACDYANQDVAVKGIELVRLKRKRDRLQEKIDAQSGERADKGRKRKKQKKSA